LLSTVCFSGSGGFGASESPRGMSGNTEVTSIVESLSMSEVDEVDQFSVVTMVVLVKCGVC